MKKSYKKEFEKLHLGEVVVVCCKGETSSMYAYGFLSKDKEKKNSYKVASRIYNRIVATFSFDDVLDYDGAVKIIPISSKKIKKSIIAGDCRVTILVKHYDIDPEWN